MLDRFPVMGKRGTDAPDSLSLQDLREEGIGSGLASSRAMASVTTVIISGKSAGQRGSFQPFNGDAGTGDPGRVPPGVEEAVDARTRLFSAGTAREVGSWRPSGAEV